METRIVNIKREPFDIYIGRGSIWGNPYKIGEDGDREEVIKKYEKWIIDKPYLLKLLPVLEGQRLGCWCKPKACHGDVLVELIAERQGKENVEYKFVKSNTCAKEEKEI